MRVEAGLMQRRGATRRDLGAIASRTALAALILSTRTRASAQSPPKTSGAEDARAIAHEGYVYAYPIVKNYLSIYQFALDPAGSQYKGPVNQVNNVARVFTPADTGVITPNSDTPYSFLILDLRAEPIVVTLPRIEPTRYYSLQIVDLYTNNVDYVGTRRDRNAGGTFLIAGPDWTGATPTGIKRVVRISTQLAYSQFRTQLFGPGDIDQVKRIQAGYTARPLSAYLGRTAPQASPALDYPAISDVTFDQQFWRYTNFLLQFCPPLPAEKNLRAQFAAIGVVGAMPWPPASMADDVMNAIEAGAKDGRQAIAASLAKVTSSVGLFGTPEEMAGKYLQRAVGAMGGIYGNSAEETIYPNYARDEAGHSLDGSKSNYTLTFPPGQLPPVDAFWSVTMYDARTQLLVDNPLQRYLVNSPMLLELKRDPDGGITLYIQHASPGADKQANWLPAPDGSIGVVMRLYLPKPDVLNGKWKPPPIRAVGPAN
jgi:hypothetical protein